MATKKKLNIVEILIFLYLVLFPFGHLLTIRINVFDKNIPINASDFISFFFLISYFFQKKTRFPFFIHYLRNFFLLLMFSQLLFICSNGLKNSVIGLLYLLRLVSYSAMFLAIWNYCLQRKNFIKKIIDYLIVVSLFEAVFGWIQYVLYPDIRTFTIWGWDDHLFRIVGTLIDPTFTAILLVFGVILSLIQYQKTKNKKFIVFLIPILLALYFTYSRSGYISLIVGVLTYLSIQKKIKIAFIVIPLFLLGIIFLPRPSSEGAHLERTFSINAKIVNYFETVKIFAKNPIFGIGYNNLCFARQYYFNETNMDSHSCSGTDSGILLILATSGIVGFIIFSSFIYMVFKELKKNYLGIIFISCFSALFVHSQFSNSIFYPWVLGYFAFLTAASIRE